MNACEPTNHPPQLEPLSQTALALAARLAGLIDRTMNLYETELTQAEEAHAAAAQTPEPALSRSSKKRASEESKVPAVRHPASPTTTVGNLRALIHSMESLLRTARHARAIEDSTPKPSDSSSTGLDRETVKALLKFTREIEEEEEKEEAEAAARRGHTEESRYHHSPAVPSLTIPTRAPP
jgi:hypothetical protein